MRLTGCRGLGGADPQEGMWSSYQGSPLVYPTIKMKLNVWSVWLDIFFRSHYMTKSHAFHFCDVIKLTSVLIEVWNLLFRGEKESSEGSH